MRDINEVAIGLCFSIRISVYMLLPRKQGNVIRAPHGAKTDDSRLLQKLLKNFAWNSTRKSSLPSLMFKVTIYWISKTGKKNVCKIIFRQDQIQT